MKLTNLSFKKSTQIGCPPTVLTDNTNIPYCAQLCPGQQQISNRKINTINGKKSSTFSDNNDQRFMSPQAFKSPYQDLQENVSRYTGSQYGNQVSQLSYSSNISQASSPQAARSLMSVQQAHAQIPQASLHLSISPNPPLPGGEPARNSRINTTPAPASQQQHLSMQSNQYMKASIEQRIKEENLKQKQAPSSFQINEQIPTAPPTNLQRCLSSHASLGTRQRPLQTLTVLTSQKSVAASEQSVKPQSTTHYRSPMKDALKSIQELNSELRVMKGQSSLNEDSRKSMLRQLSAEHKMLQQQLADQKALIQSREQEFLELKAKSDKIELENTQMKHEKVMWQMEKTRLMIKEIHNAANSSQLARVSEEKNKLAADFSLAKQEETKRQVRISTLEEQLIKQTKLKDSYHNTLQKLKRDVSQSSGYDVAESEVTQFVLEQIQSQIIEIKTTKMFAEQQIRAVEREYQEIVEEAKQKNTSNQKRFVQSLNEVQMKCDRRDAKIGLLQHQIQLANEENRMLKTNHSNLEDKIYGSGGIDFKAKQLEAQNQLIRELIMGQRCECCKTAQLFLQIEKDASQKQLQMSMNLSNLSGVETKKGSDITPETPFQRSGEGFKDTIC